MVLDSQLVCSLPGKTLLILAFLVTDHFLFRVVASRDFSVYINMTMLLFGSHLGRHAGETLWEWLFDIPKKHNLTQNFIFL